MKTPASLMGYKDVNTGIEAQYFRRSLPLHLQGSPRKLESLSTYFCTSVHFSYKDMFQLCERVDSPFSWVRVPPFQLFAQEQVL